MRLYAVMAEISDRVQAAMPELHCYPWPIDSAKAPMFSMLLPEVIEYHRDMLRGQDYYDGRAMIMLGKSDTRTASRKLGDYLSGAGEKSLVRILDETYAPWATCSSVTLTRAEPDYYTMGQVPLLGALLYLDITGKGSS